MDALRRTQSSSDDSPGADDRQRSPSRSVGIPALCLFTAVIGLCGCSSNSKPKSLPPQTIAPQPPEAPEPVSNTQQEVGPEEIPTVTTPDAASTGQGGDSLTVEPISVDNAGDFESNDGITTIVESGDPGEAVVETSLYEAAQAERRRREQASASAIVLDDKTLKRYSKDDDEAPGQEAVEAQSVTDVEELVEAEDEPAENEAIESEEADEATRLWRQEQYWRNRVLDIRVAWRESLDTIVELEEEVAGLRRDFYAEDDPFYRDSQIKPAWDRALDDLDEAKRAAERSQVELADAMEEGHRDGALPGWLREGIELEPTEEEVTETLKQDGKFVEPSEPVVVDEGDYR